MSGNPETVNYQLKQIAPLDATNKKDYYQLDPDLHNANEEMEDASFRNTRNLHKAGLVLWINIRTCWIKSKIN